MIIVTSSFSKSSVFNFTFTRKRKAGVSSQICPFLRVFFKSFVFSRNSADSRRKRRNKAAFPNCSGEVWTGLKTGVNAAVLRCI